MSINFITLHDITSQLCQQNVVKKKLLISLFLKECAKHLRAIIICVKFCYKIEITAFYLLLLHCKIFAQAVFTNLKLDHQNKQICRCMQGNPLKAQKLSLRKLLQKPVCTNFPKAISIYVELNLRLWIYTNYIR